MKSGTARENPARECISDDLYSIYGTETVTTINKHPSELSFHKISLVGLLILVHSMIPGIILHQSLFLKKVLEKICDCCTFNLDDLCDPGLSATLSKF